MEDIVVSGVVLNPNEAKITVRALPDKPGVATRLFCGLAEAKINVDMIIQNTSSDGYADISFTVDRDELDDATSVAEKSMEGIDGTVVTTESNIAKVSVIGIGMRSHSGVADIMFRTLADAKINLNMISTSEIKISVVIDLDDGERALRLLHSAFHLDDDEKEETK